MRDTARPSKSDVRRRMTRAGRSVAQGFQKSWAFTGDHPLQMEKTCGLQGRGVPANPRRNQTAGSAAEISQWCWRPLPEVPTETQRSTAGAGPVFPDGRWSCWRQAARDANAKPVLTMPSRRSSKSSAPGPAKDQSPQKGACQRHEKAMGEMRPCWCCEKSGRLLLGGLGRLTSTARTGEAIESDRRGECPAGANCKRLR